MEEEFRVKLDELHSLAHELQCDNPLYRSTVNQLVDVLAYLALCASSRDTSFYSFDRTDTRVKLQLIVDNLKMFRSVR